MMEIGITLSIASCFVPGITFHGIRTPSWDSRSSNSAIVEDCRVYDDDDDDDQRMMIGGLINSDVYSLHSHSRVFHLSWLL